MSFLTLGIFWNGQQTQLSYVDRGNRDLAWLELLFLAIIALFPFTTSLLAENIDLRLALALYWLNIFLAGAALYADLGIRGAERAVRDGTRGRRSARRSGAGSGSPSCSTSSGS